ncbi:hypothetical protein NDU88_008115 [Pleurodeles waltl]|uniref:Uncharacterized protein n=1 Tax=Pleurodeles waltl TaxID=8319 RepID=A0AAV7NXZ3_PLEWA|nr:hypothetical protein NDU88_008115 [Pleurodeles waltl]
MEFYHTNPVFLKLTRIINEKHKKNVGPNARLTPETAKTSCWAIEVLRNTINPKALLQPQQSRPTTRDDDAGNDREAASPTSNKPVADRGKDGTRGTTTGTEEEDDTPLSHAKEREEYLIILAFKGAL